MSSNESDFKAPAEIKETKEGTVHHALNELWQHETKVWSDVTHGKGTALEYLEAGAEVLAGAFIASKGLSALRELRKASELVPIRSSMGANPELSQSLKYAGTGAGLHTESRYMTSFLSGERGVPALAGAPAESTSFLPSLARERTLIGGTGVVPPQVAAMRARLTTELPNAPGFNFLKHAKDIDE